MKVREQDDLLHKLLESSVRVALRFCPLMYIRIMSKQLEREMSGCQLVDPCNTPAFNVVDSRLFINVTAAAVMVLLVVYWCYCVY